MKIVQNNSIGEVVANEYKTASIFKSHGIDFCCKGNRSIKEVCDIKNIDVQSLINELNQVSKESTVNSNDFQSWDLDLLADYIEKKHHRYVEQKIPEIKAYLNKLSKVHGDRHPELLEIERLFLGSAGALTAHMKKEELILFPYIKKIVKKGAVEKPHFGSVQNPIQMMMNEHEIEGDRFREIAGLSHNYNPPEDGCNTYRVAFALLKEFENDLHLHIHLENNILFPKAIEMEKKLNNA